jgi:hypothetical protein
VARWRRGNAGVCKTSMQGFDSLPRLKVVIWIGSSLVERFTDNEEVDGPIPSRSTKNMGQIERLTPKEGDTASFNLTAICDNCGPTKDGAFSGPVRVIYELQKWIVEDPTIDVEGSLAHACLQHHLITADRMKHNHFKLKDGDKDVGACGIASQIRYLTGIVIKPSK